MNYLLPIGIGLVALGLPKALRVLLIFGFTVVGHWLWLVFQQFAGTVLSGPPLIITGRFGLTGYIMLFAMWHYFFPCTHNYLRLGNIQALIQFPLVWRGFTEYVWRFILIFSIVCISAAVPFYLKLNNSSILVYGLLFAIINAVLEEVLWRGLILQRTVDFIGEKQALVVTALAFGFYHLSLGFPVWVCLLFSIGGFYMGGCAIKSRGLLTSTLMHLAVNVLFVSCGMIFG